MSKLSDLPNIGKKLEEQLNEVGIETIEQLKEVGSKLYSNDLLKS